VSKQPAGRLFLIPNTLGGAPETVATGQVVRLVPTISHFIVEEIRSARRYLRAIGYTAQFEDVSIQLLNEHTKDPEDLTFLKPIFSGHDMALLSEAGCPCVADPGSDLVRKAHMYGIRVTPLGVPSSILLTLMASGLNGQNFAFSGYLPRDRQERVRAIRHLDQQAWSTGQTQLFMDAPYRNNQVMEDLLTHCRANTWLCVGCDLTTSGEWIQAREIQHWKEKIPDLHKRPAMFAIGR
jgi:16S rRNA (cytidine1402-2'-O)-methyltransferase